MALTVANVDSTKQKQFRASMVTLLAEGLGGKLLKFCRHEANAVGDEVPFNNIGEATAQEKLAMRSVGNVKQGTGGDTSVVKVVIKPLYAFDWLEQLDLFKTNVDLKGEYPKSIKRSLDRGCDKRIVEAIVAQDAKLATGGDVTKTMADNFKALNSKIAFVDSLVADNPDHNAKTAVIMSRLDYASLYEIDQFTSSDYKERLGVGRYALGAAELVVVNTIPKGTIYILPGQVLCTAEWRNGDETSMKKPAVEDSYAIWARTSLGAKLGDLDCASVIKFSIKP